MAFPRRSRAFVLIRRDRLIDLPVGSAPGIDMDRTATVEKLSTIAREPART